jgi:signal transduction histidine kinase
MRAKQSSTADGRDNRFGVPPCAASPELFARFGQNENATGLSDANSRVQNRSLQRAGRPSQPVSADAHGEGLLHDARNLVSAIGLYCDLLSMPGVLKPEHQKYPEELRLLGTRSRVMIEHLMRSVAVPTLSQQDQSDRNRQVALEQHEFSPVPTRGRAVRNVDGSPSRFRASVPAICVRPVGLRTVVERCSGLLSSVANGRAIEITYGAAADVPIGISEEAIERILVNLVRNASAALDRCPRHPAVEASLSQDRHLRDPNSPSDQKRLGSESLEEVPASIRISIGHLLDRAGEARPWPFQHVRLVVEDCGCGMERDALQSLLSGRRTPSSGTHGIGFGVVRELVAASDGDLRVASAPGIGTRVQIEWPLAARSAADKEWAVTDRGRPLGSSTSLPAANRVDRPPLPAHTFDLAPIEERHGAY